MTVYQGFVHIDQRLCELNFPPKVCEGLKACKALAHVGQPSKKSRQWVHSIVKMDDIHVKARVLSLNVYLNEFS